MMGCAEWFVIGVAAGVAGSALIALYVWVAMTPGDDHQLSDEELRERIGEVYR